MTKQEAREAKAYSKASALIEDARNKAFEILEKAGVEDPELAVEELLYD